MFTNEIFTKVVISGNLIEVTKYEKPNLIKTIQKQKWL